MSLSIENVSSGIELCKEIDDVLLGTFNKELTTNTVLETCNKDILQGEVNIDIDDGSIDNGKYLIRSMSREDIERLCKESWDSISK